MPSIPKTLQSDSYLAGVFKQYSGNHDSLFYYVCQYLCGGPRNKWNRKNVYKLMTDSGYQISKGLLDMESSKKFKMNLKLRKICKRCDRPFVAGSLGMDHCYNCDQHKRFFTDKVMS